MSCVALTNVVVNAVVLNDTAAPARKPVPFTVKVNAAVPATTDAGEMVVITGVGTVIVNVTELEAGPDGLATLICADPACARSVAGTIAVTCVALTKVVASGVEFNDTTAPVKKPVPFTVKSGRGTTRGYARWRNASDYRRRGCDGKGQCVRDQIAAGHSDRCRSCRCNQARAYRGGQLSGAQKSSSQRGAVPKNRCSRCEAGTIHRKR